jgi:fluoride ion exporter CrcB/FEX
MKYQWPLRTIVVNILAIIVLGFFVDIALGLLALVFGQVGAFRRAPMILISLAIAGLLWWYHRRYIQKV